MFGHLVILLSFIVCVFVSVAGCVQKCFSHDDCIEAGHFCAWTKCIDDKGTAYACGGCRPCEECICDVNSTDFQCPLLQCPNQPINGVRYLQGAFFNHSKLQIPGYHCVRRFVVMGSTFSLIQSPIYILHPATKAKLDEVDILTTVCPTFSRSGVLGKMLNLSSRAVHLNAFISSEGDGIFNAI